MITVRRLKDTYEGFDVEAVGYDSQLDDRSLESVNSEHAGRA